MKLKNIIIFLCIISAVLISVIPNLFSKAEETAVNEEEPILTAVLYDTNQYAGGTGTVLTQEGAQVNNWKFNTSKYLQIDPQVPADGSTYIVTVKLPQEFYIVGSEIITPTGYQSVEFSKNEDISVNTNLTYKINNFSGTATYTMNHMGVSGTIQLEIRYDAVLWDKQAGSILTPENIEPITVTLSKVNNSEKTDLKKVSIKKATAGVKTSYTGSTGFSSDGSVYTSSVTVAQDKTAIFYINYTSSVDDFYMYFPKMVLKIQLPYYKDSSGNKYYLQYDESSIKLPAFSNKALYSIDSSKALTDGILLIELDNAYFSSSLGRLFTMNVGPLNDELKDIDKNSFVFSGGSVTATVDGKNGIKGTELFFVNMGTITYQKQNLENVVGTVGNKGVTITERPDDAVSEMGGFYLENKGTGNSSEKTIFLEFDYQNTNLIKVTTVNVFADTVQQYMDLKYTLVDENGNRVYLDSDGNEVDQNSEGAIGEWTYSIKNAYYNNTKTVSNLKNMFTRNMLAEKHRKYYFKTITYTIKNIKAGIKLYSPSSNATLAGAGNYYGYVSENAVGNEKIKSRMTVKSSNTDISDIVLTSTATLQTATNPTYMISNVTMSKESINAGESVNVGGRMSIVSYPYGNSTWLKGICLGIILPQDVTVNEEAITMISEKKVNITNFSVASKNIGDGHVLWTITLPEDVYFGYALENLGMLSSGTYIQFDIQLDTAFSMNNSTLFTDSMLIVTGYKQVNSASGSYSWAKKVDTYDLNQNGLTTDIIAGTKSTDVKKCQIVAQPTALNIKDCITIDRQGSITQESSNQSILEKTDIVNYNLDISCLNGGKAEGFLYYIPIPKNTMVKDNFFVNDDIQEFFNLGLIGPTIITGSDVIRFEYTFKSGLTYDQLKNNEEWYSEEDIEKNIDLQWEDVTYIKLTFKENAIENGTITRITAKLKYVGDSYEAEAGFKNIWHSGGFYTYINNGRLSSGNFPTSGISVDLNCFINMNEITLTAAKNMNPQNPNNVNTKTIEKSEFPEFKKAQTFSIIGVETYNVALQTKSYINSNIDMPGIDANRTFAVSVLMNDGSEKDIINSVETNPVQLGSIAQNNAPNFTYKIYNADAISDNSQTRYIIVTLTSNNGVTIRQKININRELAMATDPHSAIVAGKRYLMFDDTTSEVIISQDSAFSTQFVINYIPDTYSEQIITFSNNLPIGTNMILANLTDSQNPTYWYYKLNSKESIINLENFIAMGKNNEEKYTKSTGIDSVEEKIILIVDFSQCAEYISVGEYTVKMTLKGNNENIDDVTSKELKFITKARRTFSLNNDESAIAGEDFYVSYLMSEPEGSESKYEGQKLSLVINASVAVPSDISLIVNDITYYLNSNKQFIIPLGDMEKKSGTVKMRMWSNMFPNNGGEYLFNIELWVSATANASAPMLGEKVKTSEIKVIANKKIKPSLKVTNMSKRAIYKGELSNLITIDYDYIEAPNCYITLELQQKVGTGYQKITDKLNQVNNNTNHNLGAFSVTNLNGKNQATIKLSSSTSIGTYRLLFRVYDENSNQLLEIPYNFMVVENK